MELALDVLARSGRLRMRATGGSMLPAIAAGDVLEFHACNPGSIGRGQVVLARVGNGLVAHRVVGHRRDALVTRGDALRACDPPLPRADVLGLLAAQSRGGVALHAGGRHWLVRQAVARSLVRRVHVLHALFQRMPRLARLAA